MAPRQSSFVWYELMTSDVAGAKAFYASVAGWKTEDVTMPGMTYTLLRAGEAPGAEAQVGGLMALPEAACAAGMRPCWAGYIGVDDVDAGAVKVTRLGGRILGAPRDIPNVGRFATVTDPAGAMFNLFKPLQTGERAAVSAAPGHIGWHELHSADWPKAFEFYSEMFGWLKGDPIDMGPMGTYQLFTIGGDSRRCAVQQSGREGQAILAVLYERRRYRRGCLAGHERRRAKSRKVRRRCPAIDGSFKPLIPRARRLRCWERDSPCV
jgi:predicted enzyme related to lactoylglutathione lyase